MRFTLQKLATVAALAFAAAAPLSASATVLTFDDIAGASVPNGYGGLNWSNFGLVDTTAPEYENTGFANSSVSGDNVAFNKIGDPAHVLAASSGATFDFSSVFLTSGIRNQLNIDVLGYRNGDLLYSQTVVVGKLGPTAFKFDYNGIDDLKFVAYRNTTGGDAGTANNLFALDNLNFSVTTTDVPEPATLGLMGLGLAGLGASRRKSKQAKNA